MNSLSTIMGIQGKNLIRYHKGHLEKPHALTMGDPREPMTVSVLFDQEAWDDLVAVVRAVEADRAAPGQ